MIYQLASQYKIDVNDGPPIFPLQKDNHSDIVKNFQEQDEVSWQAPGKKDKVVYKESGKKVEKQARYLLSSLKETYSHFQTVHSDIKIGFTKFTLLRPKHCKLFRSLPHTVCVCIYHENIKLLLDTLAKCTDLKTNTGEFISQIVCDDSSKDCMLQLCDLCRNKIDAFTPTEEIVLEYCQWQNINGRTDKINLSETSSQIFQKLKTKLKQFFWHTFIKRHQSKTAKSITDCQSLHFVQPCGKGDLLISELSGDTPR